MDIFDELFGELTPKNDNPSDNDYLFDILNPPEEKRPRLDDVSNTDDHEALMHPWRRDLYLWG